VTGVSTAWLVSTFSFPGRDTLAWLLALPLAIPTYLAAYIYVDVFDALGVVPRALAALFGSTNLQFNVRTFGGAILIFGVVLYPYVYLAARAGFQMQGAAAIEAARSAGASHWRCLRDIMLPLARPAIAAGISLALLEALNDIGACEYLGIQTLTLSVFNTWLNRSSLSGAAQIACVMLVAVIVLIAIERMGRRRQFHASHGARPARVPLRGGRAALALAVCTLPALAGFAIPFAYLAHETVLRGLSMGFDAAIGRHAITTAWLAAAATSLTIVFGFGVALAARIARNRLGDICAALSALGYAVPGTALALGLLTPLVALDGAINAVARITLGDSVGLVFTGSSAGLVAAYVLRFAAIAIGFGQAALGRVPGELIDAARVAGASAAFASRTIHLPLLRPALWGAALLIFVDCLKELPASLLLRPLNVETLATYIFQFATRGSFEQGALAALVIVALGILPAVRVARIGDSGFHDVRHHGTSR
jgi:iron(III) transport system permease protein